MLFKVNNTLVEINKDSFNTDVDFYKSVFNVMKKITNTSVKDTKIYNSSKISLLKNQGSANHKN